MTPHKHAEVIKAWADGAEIEVFVGGGWHPSPNPMWIDVAIYRVKPKEPVTVHRCVSLSRDTGAFLYPVFEKANVVFSFDPDTLKLIKVELIND